MLEKLVFFNGMRLEPGTSRSPLQRTDYYAPSHAWLVEVFQLGGISTWGNIPSPGRGPMIDEKEISRHNYRQSSLEKNVDEFSRGKSYQHILSYGSQLLVGLLYESRLMK